MESHCSMGIKFRLFKVGSAVQHRAYSQQLCIARSKLMLSVLTTKANAQKGCKETFGDEKFTGVCVSPNSSNRIH